jgi:cyclophilin family peptidyl-prolyl cis-trans isomerase
MQLHYFLPFTPLTHLKLLIMTRKTFLSLAALLLSASSLFAEAPKRPVVTIKTTLGEIKVELDPEKAPQTVANFLSYVKEDYYSDVVFHRVMKGFMIQSGGFQRSEDGKHVQKEVKDPVQNEASNGLKNEKGTIAMARQTDPHSATSQFFINSVDNTGKLDPGGVSPDGYTVFGKVIAGLDVVEKIQSVATGNRELIARYQGQRIPSMSANVPLEDVIIKKIELEPEKAPETQKEQEAEKTNKSAEKSKEASKDPEGK